MSTFRSIAMLPLRRKVELLREMSRLLASVAEEWVSCSVEARRCATNVAGRTVARTFPAGPMDRLTLPGHTVEVHMAAGVPPDRVKEEHAAVSTGERRSNGSLLR